MLKSLNSIAVTLAVFLVSSLAGLSQTNQLATPKTTNSVPELEWIGDLIAGIVLSALWPCALGWTIAMLILSLFSFIPARRGHWSVLILTALPMASGVYALVVSICLALDTAAYLRSLGWWLVMTMCAVPLVVACFSIRLWLIQRLLRKDHVSAPLPA